MEETWEGEVVDIWVEVVVLLELEGVIVGERDQETGEEEVLVDMVVEQKEKEGVEVEEMMVEIDAEEEEGVEDIEEKKEPHVLLELVKEKCSDLLPQELLMWLLADRGFKALLEQPRIDNPGTLLEVLKAINKAMETGRSENGSVLLINFRDSSYFQFISQHINAADPSSSYLTFKDCGTASSAAGHLHGLSSL